MLPLQGDGQSLVQLVGDKWFCLVSATLLLLTAIHDQAERRKSDKYSNMDPNMYLFTPVVIKTSGVFGKQTFSFLKDLACHIRKVSGEVKSFPYRLQHLAVAVQLGNAVSILGTFAIEDCLVFEVSNAY